MTDISAPRRPTVLVTGAAGGLGGAAVTRFAAAGWRVAAADLDETLVAAAGAAPDRTLAVAMNVTEGDSVEQAMRRVEAWSPGGLDAVVTFAGVTGIGPLMETDTERLRRILDVNVLGVHRTVRASWPLVRRAGGRFILIGSETGWQQAMPLNGPYAASKHAIEAYADALRRELMFVDIDVVLVQPGPFRTVMTSRITAEFDAVPADSPFKSLAEAAAQRVASQDARASDPAVLAEAVYRAATTARPRSRYSVRPDRGRSVLSRLPVPVVDRLLKNALQRPSGRSRG